MAVTPTAISAKAPSELRDLLANSSWFQTWTGAADAAAAKAHVLIGEVDFDLDSLPDYPFVVVGQKEAAVYERGSGGGFLNGGTLLLAAYNEVTSAYKNDAENAMLEALDDAGNLAEVIAGEAATSGWRPNSVVMIEGPVFADVGEDGSTDRFTLWSVLFEVVWGLE